MRNKMLLIGFCLLLIIPVVNAGGIGIAPSLLKLHNALKGEEYSRPYVIFNTFDTSIDVSLNATGEASEWIHFFDSDGINPITEISIPGNDSVRIMVKFDIPVDTPNGEYKSTVSTQTIPSEQLEESGQVVLLKAKSLVTIQVSGTQILTGVVKSITIKDVEVNRLLKINVMFKNTGNVIASPMIRTTIKKNGNFIDDFTHGASVNTEATETIEVEWNTTGQTVGDYVANVKVLLDGKLLSEKDLDFKILERGILTAEGKILDVRAPEEIILGDVAKIEVDFENTGEIEIRAKISGEVYSNDELVDVLEGDDVLVEVDKTETLTAYFKPTNTGDYSIESYVLYEGKKAKIDQISLVVKSIEAQTEESTEIPTGQFVLEINPMIIIILFILIVVVIIFLKTTS